LECDAGYYLLASFPQTVGSVKLNQVAVERPEDAD